MNLRVISKTDCKHIYRGIFGSITTQRKSKRLSSNRNVWPDETCDIQEERITRIIMPFLQRAFEIRLNTSLGQVSRTLSFYAVLPLDAPVFKMCHDGDTGGLQKLFSSSNISPFVQDEYGRTLLHVCPEPIAFVQLIDLA